MSKFKTSIRRGNTVTTLHPIGLPTLSIREQLRLHGLLRGQYPPPTKSNAVHIWLRSLADIMGVCYKAMEAMYGDRFPDQTSRLAASGMVYTRIISSKKCRIAISEMIQIAEMSATPIPSRWNTSTAGFAAQLMKRMLATRKFPKVPELEREVELKLSSWSSKEMSLAVEDVVRMSLANSEPKKKPKPLGWHRYRLREKYPDVVKAADVFMNSWRFARDRKVLGLRS